MSDILTDRQAEGIVVITLNRPDRRNSLDSQACADLHETLGRLDGDPDVRVVVITGAGTAFCAGADMKATPEDFTNTVATPAASLLAHGESDVVRSLAAQELMASLFEKVHRLHVPVIAAVNGPAVGGGLALALACDVRIAAPEAAFGAVFIRHGISACDMGTSYHLPRLVGASRAAELMLTGRVFDAAEAERIGLVHSVVARGELVSAAIAKAEEMAAHSPLAVWMTKEVMWQNVDAPSLRHALDLENRTQIMCTATGDAQRSFSRFAAGDAPVSPGPRPPRPR